MTAVVRWAGSDEADLLDRSLEAPSGTYTGLLAGADRAGCELLVAEVDGLPVGAAVLRRATAHAGVRARWGDLPEIADLLVHPDERGDGHGTALLAAACARAREAGHRHIGIGVAQDNPDAARLYRRLGFAETGLAIALADDDAPVVRYLVRDLT